MEEGGNGTSDRFRVILLATDGSEFSMGTERVAMAMAEQHGARLMLLRLLLAEAGSPEAVVEEEEAARQMDDLARQCQERDIACTPIIKSAEEPTQGILEAVREVDAELLVIGRRGRRGLARFKVGDATAKLIAQADCPVLVVPRLVTIWNSGILLVTLPGQDGDAAVRSACRVARASQLPLTVLMVSDGDEAERLESNQRVNRLVAIAKQQGVETSGVVQEGEIDEVSLEISRQRSADLIVSEFHEERSLMDRLLGASTLIHLIGQAHCPVMVAR